MPPSPAPEALPLAVDGLEVRGSEGRLLLTVERLSVDPGAAVAIRGPSGAGKSTLLHALAGLLRPHAGRVRWGGADIAALGEADRTAFRRNHIGMIFQDFLLFEELGALQNASLIAAFSPRPARTGIQSRAQGWLDRLGLADAGARRVDSFSGGERQRIAIARALANDPAVILADEPTASLDRATGERLVEDLLALPRVMGRTLIAVTHDIALIERMDRVLTIIDGRVIEDAHA